MSNKVEYEITPWGGVRVTGYRQESPMPTDKSGLIAWAVAQCERLGIPPTDSAIVRMLRGYPEETHG